VSNVENYLTLSARLALSASLGRHVQFLASFDYGWDQSHLISFADAGVDRPTCSAGETSGCEMDENDIVDPGSAEVNPFHVPAIDGAGHRYRVDGSRAYRAGIHALFMF
jgi:hypothetical protein